MGELNKVVKLHWRHRNELTTWVADHGWQFGIDIQYDGEDLSQDQSEFDTWCIPDDQKRMWFLLRWS